MENPRNLKNSRAPRPCRQRGCPNLSYVANGFCEQHQDIAQQIEARRKEFFRTRAENRVASSKRGYGANWRKIRDSKLRHDPFCEICNRPADVVHHKDKNQFNNAEGNLQSLCRSCHEKLHHRMKGGVLEKLRSLGLCQAQAGAEEGVL